MHYHGKQYNKELGLVGPFNGEAAVEKSIYTRTDCQCSYRNLRCESRWTGYHTICNIITSVQSITRGRSEQNSLIVSRMVNLLLRMQNTSIKQNARKAVTKFVVSDIRRNEHSSISKDATRLEETGDFLFYAHICLNKWSKLMYNSLSHCGLPLIVSIITQKAQLYQHCWAQQY